VKFALNDTVECTDASGTIALKVGKQYTVTGVEEDFIGLKGIKGGSVGWFDWRFKLAKRPTLATDISFKPSTRRVLAHLRKRGSISVLEALAAWGTARIAPAIHDLRAAGYVIDTVKKTDAGGHQYSRYVLKAA
jgi:hypothetical protein